MEQLRRGFRMPVFAMMAAGVVLSLCTAPGCVGTKKDSAPSPNAPAVSIKDPAALIPSDVFLFVSAPDVTASIERFEQMSIYGLYTDPAMRGFVVPTEKTLRALFERKLRKSWREDGLDVSPSSLPCPDGKVVLAVRMSSKAVRYPVYDMENYDGMGTPEIKEYKTRQVVEPVAVMLIDMGENLADAKHFVSQVDDERVKNGWTRRRGATGGIDTVTLTPPARKAAEDGDPADDDREPWTYALHGGTYVISSDAALLDDVLALMSGADRPSLADNQDYTRVFGKLGAGDAMMYLNIKGYLEMALAGEESAAGKDVSRMYEALGLNNVSTLGCVVQLAPGRGEEWRVKALLGVRGDITGLAEVLVPPSISTGPGKGLVRGLTSFVVANYDLPKVYDQVRNLVREATGVDIDGQIRMAMRFMAARFEQPLDIRKDLLAGLLAPVTVTTGRPSGVAGESSEMLVSIPVRDAGAFEAAIGRLHDMFVPGDTEKFRRELRDKNVYLLPLGKALGLFIPMDGAGHDDVLDAAMAVSGENFVIGHVGAVEQAIGDLDRKGIKSIRTDSMYDYASRWMPERAGIFFYRNEQLSSKAEWAYMKSAVGKAPCAAAVSDKVTIQIVSGGLMESLYRSFSDRCDFSLLPDYKHVKKYWGASVGHAVRRKDGIYAEFVSISAPKAQEQP